MAQEIGSLHVRSFRQLRDLELRDLSRVNVFVGANNSGKTTILEAVSLFCRPLDPLEWLGVAHRRRIRSSRESPLEGVRWLFPQNGADPDDAYFEGEIRLEGRGAFPCLELLARFHGFSVDAQELRSNGGAEEASLQWFGYLAQAAKITLSARVPRDHWVDAGAVPNDELSYEFELFENERFTLHEPPSEPKLPVASVSPFSHRVDQLQVGQLSEAILTGRKFNVLECVNLIDGRIAGLEILSRRGMQPSVWVRYEQAGYAPLYTLGDGVRRVLTMALSLVEAQNGVLLIDEIETAIHKDVLGRVFEWLVQAAQHYNVQLFVTTHSLEAVDAMLQAESSSLGQLAAFRLPAVRTDEVVARYSGEALHELRFESGLEVR